VPIASLVMVCELAGSYDLLVPLMLATGISFIALRHRSLYHAQRATLRDSPAHRDELVLDVLRDVRVADVAEKQRPYVSFRRRTSAVEVVRQVAGAGWQDVFPVLSEDQKVIGIITTEVLRIVAQEPSVTQLAIADDMMMPPVVVLDTDAVSEALEVLLRHDAREVVVVDHSGTIVGFLDESDITRLYRASTRASSS
jgi:CIC family chloride channel protein